MSEGQFANSNAPSVIGKYFMLWQSPHNCNWGDFQISNKDIKTVRYKLVTALC